MHEFFKSWRFKVLAAVFIVLIAFMLRAAYTGGLGTIASNVLGFITMPFQKVSASISNTATDLFITYIKAGETRKENEQLKKQIRELEDKLIDYEDIKQKNEQYKDFLNIKERSPDLEFEPASVIGRDPNARFYSFTIDVGTIHGVSLYDPVITSDGLVGIIYEISANFSKVRTILDVAIDVGAYNPRTMDTGIITGDIKLFNDNCTKLTYISRESEMKEGDIIVTSGISGVFPKDMKIGKIKSVNHEEHGMSLYAVIEPIVDIKNIKDVFVVKSFEGQGSEISIGEETSK